MRTLLLCSALALSALCGNAAFAADGALDTTFGTDAEFPGFGFYANPNGTPNFTLDSIGAVVKRGDGKLWVVGRMTSPGTDRLSLYRVGADGYPDMDFGSGGLRTVVGPCEDFSVGAGTLDAQGRLVVAINGCPDFMAYRFLANGDLDLTLAGSGVLTVPFNAGGSNEDFSQQIATTANSSILLAGTVSTATTRQLGIAHFTATGQPVAGFGSGGKVLLPFEWSVPEIRGVNGLHRMSDGRIVVAGAISETSQAVSDKKQFVVRLLTNGAMDPSFGNVSAGVSKVSLKSSLGLTESPWVYDSLLEPDGSVVQVGKVQSNNVNSSGNIFLLRWRPDGLPDTGIGAFGTREYALDFSGATPEDPDFNWETGYGITRQADGKYLILAMSRDREFTATAVVRLKRNFAIDTSFGTGGKVQYLLTVSTTGQHGLLANELLIDQNRIIAAGTVYTGLNGRLQTMFAMQHDSIFAATLD